MTTMTDDRAKAEARAKEWLIRWTNPATVEGSVHERALTDLILSVQEETRRENAGLELKALKRGDHFKAKLAERNAEVKRVVEEVRSEVQVGKEACDEILRRLGLEK
jgi:hypothetical protein